MLARFEIAEEGRDVIFPIVDTSEAVEKIKQLPEQVREEALTWLLEAASADNKIVAEERTYLKAVAQAMGLSDEELDRRITEKLG